MEKIMDVLRAVRAISNNRFVFWHPVTWITVVLYFVGWMIFFVLYKGLFGFFAELLDTDWTWKTRS